MGYTSIYGIYISVFATNFHKTIEEYNEINVYFYQGLVRTD
jgi:hypothetical protein